MTLIGKLVATRELNLLTKLFASPNWQTFLTIAQEEPGKFKILSIFSRFTITNYSIFF